MKIEADLHTHSVASGHAYSTIAEMAQAAGERGMKMIAVTDHGPAMPGGPHQYFFGNLKVIPEIIYGVRVLMGIEANIQSNGELDLSPERLEKLDFVAAGIHSDAGYDNKSRLEHTEATIKAIKNPLVKMITHPANLYYSIDSAAIAQAAAEYQVILEINASSFDQFRLGKRGSKELTLELCRMIRKYGASLSLNSDAHFYTDVGNIKPLTDIINEAGLTETDAINCSARRVEKFLGLEGEES